MKKIYIKTTESCQLKCKHCYIGDNRNIKDFFDENKTISWIKSYMNTFRIDERDILFSFHGGEPFLCPLEKIEKFIHAFPDANFDATSNLCFDLTLDHLKLITLYFYDNNYDSRPFIKTSWDYKIRFTDETFNVWKNNIKKLIKRDLNFKVNICLTSFLIDEMTPEELLDEMKDLGIININFERLTENTTENKTLIPNYNKQDEWLLKFYEISKDIIVVDMFEELSLASKHIFTGCRKRCCMDEVITINANGTIGGCPNSAIYDFYSDITKPAIDIVNSNKKFLIQKEQSRNIGCFYCDLYHICNGDCHQLSWQNGVCPAPKKLIRRIYDDMERAKKIILPNK